MGFNNDKAVEIYSKKNKLFKEEEQAFQKYLTEPKKILDLGCGTGRTTRILSDMGHSVIGLDISPLMIEQAKKQNPGIDFVVGDASKLYQPDSSFDVVLFSFNGLDCLYPLKNRYKALKEINRVLKPGGLFIYSSHEIRFLISWRAIRRIRLYDYPYFKERTVYNNLILYYGTKQQNQKQLTQTGFKLIDTLENENHSWIYYIGEKKK